MAVFYTGATGVGSGPHLDFRVYDPEKGDYVDPRGFETILRVGGKPLTEQYRMTSGYGPRNTGIPGASRFHKGLDYATPENTPVEVVGGRYMTTFRDKGGGIMSQYAFERDGKTYEALLLHGSPKNQVLTGAAVDSANFAPPPVQTSTPSSEEPAPVWGSEYQGDVSRVDTTKLLGVLKAKQEQAIDFSGTDPVLAQEGGDDISRIEKALRQVVSERKRRRAEPVAQQQQNPVMTEVQRTQNLIGDLAQQAMSSFRPGKSVL
jgi:hypothetical protein